MAKGTGVSKAMEILVSTLLRSVVAATLWFILRVLTPGEPSRTEQRMARSVEIGRAHV